MGLAEAPRRSLRTRALGVVLLMVLFPLAVVWLSAVGDAMEGRVLRRRVEAVAAEAAGEVGEPDVAARLEDIARDRGVRLRWIDPAGTVVVDRDHSDPEGLAAWSADFFFGPGGAPSLGEWERGQGPVVERPEVLEARSGGPVDGSVGGQGTHCRVVLEQRMQVCAAALALPGGLVHVEDDSLRAIRSLHDQRYPLLKLTLVSLVAGVLLGTWLSWRLIRPIEQLVLQVRARAARGGAEALELDRQDEFGELARAFNELLCALRARGEANEAFAADLAHEIKNPVAAVRAAAERLQSGAALDPARAARLGRILRDSSDRLELLARRFLELARAEGGLRDQPREPLDLGRLALARVEQAAADPRNEGLRFSFVSSLARDPEGVDGASVLGVPERLETVLQNLLDNAASFAREAAGPEGGRVEVTVEADGGTLRLTVRDNGPGVPEADRPRVFERFFSRRAGGTGLGLALSRAIAEAHGGRLRLLEPSPGRPGAAFALELPRHRPVGGSASPEGPTITTAAARSDRAC